MDVLTPYLNWFNITVGLIGVFGVGFAVVTHFRHKARAELSYRIGGWEILGKQEITKHRLEVLNNSRPIKQLTLTRLVVWNSGNTQIPGNSVVPADPIRFSLVDAGEVISVHVAERSRPANDIDAHISLEPDGVTIAFDYLEPNDGATVDILHTSTKWEMTASGSVRGIPKGLTKSDYVGGLNLTAARRRPTNRLLSSPDIPVILLAIILGARLYSRADIRVFDGVYFGTLVGILMARFAGSSMYQKFLRSR